MDRRDGESPTTRGTLTTCLIQTNHRITPPLTRARFSAQTRSGLARSRPELVTHPPTQYDMALYYILPDTSLLAAVVVIRRIGGGDLSVQVGEAKFVSAIEK